MSHCARTILTILVLSSSIQFCLCAGPLARKFSQHHRDKRKRRRKRKKTKAAEERESEAPLGIIHVGIEFTVKGFGSHIYFVRLDDLSTSWPESAATERIAHFQVCNLAKSLQGDCAECCTEFVVNSFQHPEEASSMWLLLKTSTHSKTPKPNTCQHRISFVVSFA